MWGLTLSMNFCISKAHDLVFLGPISWTCSSAQNVLKQVQINPQIDSLYIWVRFHLMWNVEFNFLDNLLCIGVHDFGVLGLSLSDLPQFPKYTKTGLTQPSDCLYLWVRLHLMSNVEFNTLNDFLCIIVDDVGYLGLICPTCPNSPNILKQV